jgi:Protein of unknown function (DUF2961)
MIFMRKIITAILVVISVSGYTQLLYDFPAGTTSGLSSFENLNSVKGAGGKTNKTAKGNAFEMVKPGESKVMLDINGPGIIQRIWLTVNQNPVMLRSLRLQMFWDGEKKPAVDVPLGDFFGSNLGRKIAYQSALFSTAEGRSFNCYIPMPFRKGAKVVLINESKNELCKLFYDIDFIRTKTIDPKSLYFHAIWSRQETKKLGDDVTLLPKVNGKGRFLGISAALNTDSLYAKTWWGEGEVKMYVDGDAAYPTINGTGAEDYLGSGWGLGTFTNLYQGCTIADEPKRQFNFYRLHIPDAVYFNNNIRVVLQQIGGGTIKEVKELLKNGVNLKPVSIDNEDGFYRLMDSNKSINDYNKGWVNFYRIDDYAVTTYFYLDKPSNDLPPLNDLETRIKNVQ